MEDTVPNFPLQWPVGRLRTLPHNYKSNPFRTGLEKAMENVRASLRGFSKDAGVKIENVVLSSNADFISVNPSDPGVAVWFKLKGQWVCFAVDVFPTLSANIQAVHHIIEARRVELRYGGFEFVQQTFKSFLALPSPGVDSRPWWKVLLVSSIANRETIDRAYRDLAKTHHPDKGGDAKNWATLQRAYEEAKAQCQK